MLTASAAVYAYEPTSPLYVFSTNGIKMKDVDLTDMKNLVLVNLSEFPVVVADDASAVVSDLQIGVFLVDE